MKRLLPFAALLLALAVLPGCQSPQQVTLSQRLTQAEKGYRLVLTTMADARDAGLVTQGDLDATKPARKALDAALANAEAAAARGDTQAAQVELNAAAAALGQLQPLLDQIDRKKASP